MQYTEIKNGVVFIKVTDSFNIRVADKVKEEIDEALDMGEKKVHIDMSQTTYIDSSGLGVLIDVKNRLKDVAGEIIVTGLCGYCLEVFEATRLDEEFCPACEIKENAL